MKEAIPKIQHSPEWLKAEIKELKAEKAELEKKLISQCSVEEILHTAELEAKLEASEQEYEGVKDRWNADSDQNEIEMWKLRTENAKLTAIAEAGEWVCHLQHGISKDGTTRITAVEWKQAYDTLATRLSEWRK